MVTERPLTRRELARLLRVLANMLETTDEPEKEPRVRRKRRGAGAPISDINAARVERALRRSGVLA